LSHRPEDRSAEYPTARACSLIKCIDHPPERRAITTLVLRRIGHAFVMKVRDKESKHATKNLQGQINIG
jgi:hypothetical protein